MLLPIPQLLLLLLLLLALTLHEAHSQVFQHYAITASKERQHILDEVLLIVCKRTRKV
jgi:hypothetical protein